MRKYFISDTGTLVGNQGEDHADIARRVLPTYGVKITDYNSLYTGMFGLGFARVATDAVDFMIERAAGLSRSQQQHAEDALLAGKNVYINNQRFTESKHVRGTSGTVVEQLLKA